MFTEPIKELWNENFIYIFKFILILLLVVLGPHGCVWAFSVVASRGYSLAEVRGLLLRGLLLLWSMRLYNVGSVVVVHGLSRPTACRIFPDLESFKPLSPELAG